MSLPKGTTAQTDSQKTKATKKPQNPKKEQAICVTCGFCCDGTLFNHATLLAGEKGSLPEYMEQSYFKNESGEYFRLPCEYFNEKCSIYDQKKANVCSAFRCQLLQNFSKKKVTRAAAKKLVKNARVQLKDIIAFSGKVLNTPNDIPFRKLLGELHDLIHTKNENNPRNQNLDLLAARCNIFEALLIRYFKSEENFNSMKVPLYGEDPNEKQ